MAGIPQTIAALSTQMQNLAATLEARTGAQRINLVTAPEYGADPTGAADSTAAFAAALAGPSVAVVPPGLYRLNNLVVPSGASLVGHDAIGYAKTWGDANATVLVARDVATTRVLNVDNAFNVRISGLQIDCDPARNGVRNTTCDGISAGSVLLDLSDVTVRWGRFGLGGQVSAKSYSSICMVRNCQVFDCVTGIGDLWDAWLTNVYLSNCTDGAVFSSPSAAITIVGCRVEWNTGDGIRVVGGSDILIGTTLFDRNFVSALNLVNTLKVAVNGCHFNRNGRNLDANSCHVRFNSVEDVVFTGCMSRRGTDDDGSGNQSPAVWAREQGTSRRVTFVGNDLLGLTGDTLMTLDRFWVGTLPQGYTFVANSGLAMEARNGAHPVATSGFALQHDETKIVAAGATAIVGLVHDPLPTWSTVAHKIRITARNQATGADSSVEFNYLIQREGGGASLTQSAAMGTIGTAGVIAFGSGTVRLSWTAVATDASTYSLSIQNTSTTDAHTVMVQVM